MNDRDRYLATMDYQAVDRPFVTEWGYWPETLERWTAEGAPADLHWNGSDDNNTDAAFGLDSYRTYLPVELGLCPAFGLRQVEDRGEAELIQQADGVQVVRSKRMSSIPHPEKFWEDICFNSGPMIAPGHAREFLLPHYQRITSFCRENGVRWFALDSDGRLDHLIPVWMEGGINILYPVEIGTCGNDVAALRKEFGRGMHYMGGFDKRILAQGPATIDAEFARLAPLIREGGFIPFCDHHVPPDVPLAHFQHYLNAKGTTP